MASGHYKVTMTVDTQRGIANLETLRARVRAVNEELLATSKVTKRSITALGNSAKNTSQELVRMANTQGIKNLTAQINSARNAMRGLNASMRGFKGPSISSGGGGDAVAAREATRANTELANATDRVTRSNQRKTRSVAQVTNALARKESQTRRTTRAVADKNNALLATIAVSNRVLSNLSKVVIGIYSVRTAARLLTGTIGGLLDSGIRWQESMSRTAAFSGATREELEALEYISRKYGKSTIYDPSEVAEGMAQLSLVGLDPGETIKSIESVLHLATIGGISMADAAEIAGSTMQAFGVEAEDFIGVVNVMASVATNTSSTVESLAAALRYTSASASTFGRSYRETIAALGVIQTSGLKGTMSGTSLNNMINDLSRFMSADASSSRNTLLRQIGLTPQDIDPATMSLLEIAERLRDAREAAGMTANEFKRLFGERGFRGVVPLVDNFERFKKVYEEADPDGDQAELMSHIMKDNVSGDITRLKSALTEIRVEFFSTVEGPIRDMLQAATKWVNEKGGLIVATTIEAFSNRELLGDLFVVAAQKFWEVVSPIGSFLGQMFVETITNSNVYKIAANMLIGMARVMLNIAAGIITGVAGVVENFDTIWGGIKTSMSGIFDSFIESIDKHFGDLISAIQGGITLKDRVTDTVRKGREGLQIAKENPFALVREGGRMFADAADWFTNRGSSALANMLTGADGRPIGAVRPFVPASASDFTPRIGANRGPRLAELDPRDLEDLHGGADIVEAIETSSRRQIEAIYKSTEDQAKVLSGDPDTEKKERTWQQNALRTLEASSEQLLKLNKVLSDVTHEVTSKSQENVNNTMAELSRRLAEIEERRAANAERVANRKRLADEEEERMRKLLGEQDPFDLGEWQKAIANIGNAIESNMISSLEDVVFHAGNVKDAFRDMVASILQDLAKLAIRRMLVNTITNAALNSFTPEGGEGGRFALAIQRTLGNPRASNVGQAAPDPLEISMHTGAPTRRSSGMVEPSERLVNIRNNESVLTKEQKDNLLSENKGGGEKPVIINAFDETMVRDALSKYPDAILNVVSKHKREFKMALS